MFVWPLNRQHLQVIAKIENLDLSLGYRYVTQVPSTVAVSLKICFDSGQFADGAKNLHG